MNSEEENDIEARVISEELEQNEAVTEEVTEVVEVHGDASAPDIHKFITSTTTRKVTMPCIDHLDDAIDKDGAFVPQVGMNVVIERWFDGKWLDTRELRVRAVDVVTGDLKLYDDKLQQYARSNYIKGPASGYKFKLPRPKMRKLTKREQSNIEEMISRDEAKR